MDCWIVMACANYKILTPDPIALPRSCRFSTFTVSAWLQASTIDLPQARS
jgi:hypothetical protein